MILGMAPSSIWLASRGRRERSSPNAPCRPRVRSGRSRIARATAMPAAPVSEPGHVLGRWRCAPRPPPSRRFARRVAARSSTRVREETQTSLQMRYRTSPAMTAGADAATVAGTVSSEGQRHLDVVAVVDDGRLADALGGRPLEPAGERSPAGATTSPSAVRPNHPDWTSRCASPAPARIGGRATASGPRGATNRRPPVRRSRVAGHPSGRDDPPARGGQSGRPHVGGRRNRGGSGRQCRDGRRTGQGDGHGGARQRETRGSRPTDARSS